MFKFIKKLFLSVKNFFKKLTQIDLLDSESIVNYIYSNESLPEPLNTEEEYLTLIDMQNGSETAKSKLIEHNLRLVMYIAKKFENNRLELQDLVSVGSIGLIKAINSYKIDKNIKLATYASRCIENEILMYLRKVNKSINDLSLDSALPSDDEGDNLSLGELIPDDHQISEEVEKKDQQNYMMEIVNELNDRDKEIMFMRYGLEGRDELTQKEVADLMDISQSYISRLEKKILHKLKTEMTKSAM